MAQMKTLLLLLLVASIPVMYADSSAETQNEINEPVNEEIPEEYEDDPEDIKGILETWAEGAIEDALIKYEGFYIPALPTINVNFGEVVSISLALAQLNLTGISNVTVTHINFQRPLNTSDLLLEMNIPIVELNVGHYSSGGHILNLPFSGEGPLLIALHKLYIKIDYKAAGGSSGEICAKAGSTTFDLDLPRFDVEFTNMNPGTDLGQLLNIVLSSFGADIVDYLEILINGQFNEATQQLFLDVVNANTPGCEEFVSDEPLDELRMKNYMNDLWQHYLKAFKVPGSINFN